MKIALLSHRGGNIGHDFMAIGIESALKQAFGASVQIDHFEQHRHFEVYPKTHWLHWVDKIPHGKMRFVRHYLNKPSVRQRLWKEALPLKYNLAVASGGPNIVKGGSHAAELSLMLHHMNGAFHYRGVPLVDAGIGACFPLEHVPSHMTDPVDRHFYKTAFEFCAQISVRDKVALALVRDLGCDAALLPCAAIGSGRIFERSAQQRTDEKKYIVINFQRWGANTDWGQGVNPAGWMQTMQDVIADLEKRHPLLLLAHSPYEKILAKKLAPHIKCALPTTIEDYAQTIAGAKAGIVSRIHAAIPLAGIGIPSVVIGTDTRLGTVEEMGLPTMFVKHASPQWIIEQTETLLAHSAQEHERLIALRENTMQRYAKLFLNTIKDA